LPTERVTGIMDEIPPCRQTCEEALNVQKECSHYPKRIPADHCGGLSKLKPEHAARAAILPEDLALDVVGRMLNGSGEKEVISVSSRAAPPNSCEPAQTRRRNAHE